jgi:hypothetical protein
MASQAAPGTRVGLSLIAFLLSPGPSTVRLGVGRFGDRNP